jgi:hypothetical protein
MAGVMGMLTIVSGLATAAGAGFSLMLAFMGVVFAILTSPIGLLIAGIAWLVYWWDDLKASFGDGGVFYAVEFTLVNLIAAVGTLIDGVKYLFSFDWSIISFDGIKNFALDSVGLGGDKDIYKPSVKNSYGYESDDDAPDISAFLGAPKKVEFSKGNKESLLSNRGTNIEKVEVNTSQGINASSLEGLIGMGA